MAVIDRVKWDANDQIYAWKFPSEELSTKTQLIVAETQEAVLVKEGQMQGPFLPGRHVLDTKNFPFLVEFLKIPLGGKTPFTAEIWFVNKTMTLDVKWGTANPIQLQDPKYKVMLPVRAYGQFGVQIEHTKKFLIKLVGTVPSFDRTQLVSYFRGLIISRVKSAIAKEIVKSEISILEISAHLDEMSAALQSSMVSELKGYGIKLVNFYIKSINTPEEDPAVITLKTALAKKAEMDIIGFNYQQERTYDTLETAAGNQGSGQAQFMGAGMGLGMGVGVGGAMGGAMGELANNLKTDTSTCPHCNAAIQPGARFCPACGTSQESGSIAAKPAQDAIVCDKCGTASPQSTKFCPKCGDPFICCPKCGTDNPAGVLHCSRCGEAMPLTCSRCKETVPGSFQFCPQCGNQMVKKCLKCEAEVRAGIKFCQACGHEIDAQKE